MSDAVVGACRGWVGDVTLETIGEEAVREGQVIPRFFSDGLPSEAENSRHRSQTRVQRGSKEPILNVCLAHDTSRPRPGSVKSLSLIT